MSGKNNKKKQSDESKVRRLATRARRNVAKLERGEKPESLKWEDVDALLVAGGIPGVPKGTDLEEFMWQKMPESRPQVEARNPGRVFKPKAWGK